jgi:hypothetical protein
MLRLLIEDVTLTKGDALHVDIRFVGGATRSCATTIIIPFLATVTFPDCFGCYRPRFFGVFLDWFSSFAGAGFRPPGGGGRRPAPASRGGILRA